MKVIKLLFFKIFNEHCFFFFFFIKKVNLEKYETTELIE